MESKWYTMYACIKMKTYSIHVVVVIRWFFFCQRSIKYRLYKQSRKTANKHAQISVCRQQCNAKYSVVAKDVGDIVGYKKVVLKDTGCNMKVVACCCLW